MKRIELDKLVELVRILDSSERPVPAKDLASRLGVHVATVRNYLRVLRKDMHVDIPFCRSGLQAPTSYGKLSGFFE